MAKLTKEEFISSLKEMTLLEINELVEAMKEEFGVDPSAVAVAGPTTSETIAEPETVSITLTNAGPNKIQVIKTIREIMNLGLKEAKDVVDAGGTIKENINVDEANEIKAKLEEVGASVEVK